MQRAETVLDVLRERGRRGLPVEGIYRQLFNPQLYLLAYGRIYSNKGAMTPGPDAETADGMTMTKIKRIIDAVRHERYRVPTRPATLHPKEGRAAAAAGSAVVVGQAVGRSDPSVVGGVLRAAVLRALTRLPARPRVPHRLGEVARTWTGTSWFIEGDISQCFDRLDSRVMLDTLGEKIHDNRLLRLIGQMLAAGYLEDWAWNATLSGVPQGGVLTAPTQVRTSSSSGRFGGRREGVGREV